MDWCWKGSRFQINYEPAESTTGTFGGNSNWRGPVWFPMNFLIIEALQRLSHYYGDSFTVMFPIGSGNRVNLEMAAKLISQRLVSIFMPDSSGNRPVFGDNSLYQKAAGFKNYVLFFEYFHGDTGPRFGRESSDRLDRTGSQAATTKRRLLSMITFPPKSATLRIHRQSE